MRKIQMLQPDEMSFDAILAEFLTKCKVKNLSQATIKCYSDNGKILGDYMTKNSINQMDSKAFDDFVLSVQMSHNNPITCNTIIRNVRAILYYAMECGYIDSFKIHLIKAEKKIKPTYSEAELKTLLAKPDVKECTFSDYRTWALENYLLGTGNRISSALSLKNEDIHFDEGVIIIKRTKNRKQQIIPLSKALASVLMDYMRIRKGKGDDYLFCNAWGEYLNVTACEHCVRRYNRKRGVELTSLHAFRHTFAKLFLLNGGDAFRLQKMLGHSDLTVTKEYVNMFTDDLKQGFDELSPLDSIEGKKPKIEMTSKRKNK